MGNFHCLGRECPDHCCGAYSGVSPKLLPLGKTNPSEIILLPKDLEALKDAGYGELISENADGIARINTSIDGTCSALKDGRCTIYKCRPAICKAYPLYLDMFSGVCVLKECPAVPSDARLEQFSDALKSLLDIYQYWIDIYKQKR